tara:strand:+ start:1050 stop:1952 length:903 start_codon:yes stop_codon:yes gene_type:complete
MSLLSGICKVCVPAPAKINLFLSVGGKRSDGFHEIRSVLAKVQLYDLVTIRKTEEKGKTTISCPGNVEIANNQNLAVQMVDNWRSATGFEGGIDISIDKKIPIQAGLGGGSSDAVSTLIGLNLFSQKKLNFEELHELSSRVGSDCPSFLLGAACVASGRGEQIGEVKSDASKGISCKRVLLFKPSCGFSTADIYGRYRVGDSLFSDTNQMDERIEHWESGQLSLIDLMYNDLSRPVLEKFIFITVLFEELRERFKLNPMVSGSGSCCFFIIPEGCDLEPIKQLIRDSWGEDIFLTEAKLI